MRFYKTANISKESKSHIEIYKFAQSIVGSGENLFFATERTERKVQLKGSGREILNHPRAGNMLGNYKGIVIVKLLIIKLIRFLH